MKFTHLLLALLLIGMPFITLAQENVAEEEEQKKEEEVPTPAATEEEEVSSETATTGDSNGYVHLVIRRSFVNKTFSETIPGLVRVQIFNLGTA